MNRDELETELRKLYVAHQENESWPRRHWQCSWCDGRMSKVMALVDAYTEGRQKEEGHDSQV